MKIIGSGKGIHSPEFHKKKVRRMRIKQALMALALGIIVGVPITLARMERFLISSVEVSGNNVAKSEHLERIVSENLSGSYFGIFPRSNAILYPEEEILKDLMEKEPRLNSVAIERVSTKRLKVEVSEREPAAQYCKNTENPNTPEDCYFLDATGYAFAPAPAFSGNVYLTYTHDTPIPEPVGKHILQNDVFAASREFVRSVGDLGIYPHVFLIKSDEYRLVLSNGAEIIWSKEASFVKMRENLAAFLGDTSIGGREDLLSRVLYIDLRFDNKIFYKFRDEA